MEFKTLLLLKEGPFLWCKLNRPDVRNAFNPEMISELTLIPNEVTEEIRAVILCGEGSVFSAGGDLNWMRQSLNLNQQQNREDALRLAAMLLTLDRMSVPLIGMIHGAAMGGGVGLVCVCDYAIVEAGTTFSFSETRLGIIPACIAPFVIRKIGPGHARALFVTAERFDAKKAYDIGLIHKIASGRDDLLQQVLNKAQEVVECGPAAVHAAKDLIFHLLNIDDDRQLQYAAEQLASIRVSAEGQEGLRAFLDKRKPAWSRRDS